MPFTPPTLHLLTPEAWPEYELIDSGDLAKLERFGPHILARPEPQALWRPALPPDEWRYRAGATFTKAPGGSAASDKGQWQLQRGMPEQWHVRYQLPPLANSVSGAAGPELRFRLGLSAFKHVGLFPEQEANWRWLYAQTRALRPGASSGKRQVASEQLETSNQKLAPPKVLNLFAYTGAASIALRAAGADVTHLDAVRQVNFWARENMEASGQQDIRWIVDDALAFARREVRRGNKYQGIALDPPAYGRGPNGEKWLLEEHLPELLHLCGELLDREQPHFFLLNLYSLGFSALILDSLGHDLFGAVPNREIGELYLPDQAGRTLPLGTFYRFGVGFEGLKV